MAGSASVVTRDYDAVTGIKKITWTWLSDASDGSCICEAVKVKGRIQRVVTNPGSAAPTDNYNVVINDEDSVDVMAGQMANRHTTTSQVAYPLIGTIPVMPLVLGELTPVIAAAGNAKTGTIVLYYQEK